VALSFANNFWGKDDAGVEPLLQRMLNAKEIDACRASRPHVMVFSSQTPGTRLLPDNMFGVPQTIIVPKDKTAALETVNRFLDDVRASGFLQSAVEKSGIIGLSVAPAGSWTPSVPDDAGSPPGTLM